MNLRQIRIFLLISVCFLVASCSKPNSSIAAVLTSEKSFSEQNYKVKLSSGEVSYALSIVVNQGASNCSTCVISVGIVQTGENPQVIQTGDSVTITGSGASYQKEKVMDVQLAPGEYVLMIDGKPTPSRITVMS